MKKFIVAIIAAVIIAMGGLCDAAQAKEPGKPENVEIVQDLEERYSQLVNDQDGMWMVRFYHSETSDPNTGYFEVTIYDTELHQTITDWCLIDYAEFDEALSGLGY